MAQVADTLNTKQRLPGNKSTARQLRASGWVPAVAYGPSSEPRHLAVDPKAFLLARIEHGVAHIYDVKVEGAEGFKALIKQIDQDPVSRQLLHIDFYAVDMNIAIRVEVRLDLVGKAPGVIEGGLVQQIQRRVEISCLPGAIPANLEVDIGEMNVGDTLHLSDIVLPEGVKTTAVADEAVVILSAPEVEEEPEVELADGELPEGEVAAEGEGESEGASADGDAEAADDKKDKKDKKK